MPGKIGRNDPCPCGSGKKYKKCCGANGNTTTDIGELANGAIEKLLERYMDEQNPQSPQEAYKAMQNFFERELHSGRYRVEALSFDDIRAMLHDPYDCPEVVQFHEILDVDPDALIIDLFDLFVRAAKGEGLKATAKGNLSRKIAREAQTIIINRYPERLTLPPERIYREEDVILLDIVRGVSEIAGLIKLNQKKKCFRLTKKAEELLAIPNYRAVYPALMKSYIMEFNWAYGDGCDDMPQVQQLTALSLYMLSRSGGAWRETDEYTRDILNSFPKIIEGIKDTYYQSATENFVFCYSLRTFDRFGRLFNLVKYKDDDKENPFSPDIIKSGPMIDHVCKFIVNHQEL